MSRVEEIIRQSKALTIGKVEEEQILQAEEALNFGFSQEYKQFLSTYGALVHGSSEIFGLGVRGHMNVVQATLEERNLAGNSLHEYIVIQNEGIGGILIVMDKQGEIYEWRGEEKLKISNSFVEFIEQEID